MINIYGIKNCNTVKKALNWFESRGIQYTFHDFKKVGVDVEKLRQWEQHFGWETLLNKKGTTWRKLPEEVQQQTKDAASALQLMSTYSSSIKRPVVEGPDGKISLGFDEPAYQKMVK